MREIKFRAWNKINKTMLEIFDNTTQKEWFLPNCKEHYEIMQYTGLKDKNGKEIYEGDVFVHHFEPNQKGIVKYGEYRNVMNDDRFGGHVGFYIEWQDEFTRSTTRCDLGYWAKHSEVAGNIYQNKELLAEVM